MSKKYKGQLCVYCGRRPSDGRDHVFCRQFFHDDERHDLPAVPACRSCNNRKSELEHYACTVFAFGGRHPAAWANLEKTICRRLGKNKKLLRSLATESQRVWCQESSGPILPSMAVPMDSNRVLRLFEFIGRGLLWHHWRTRLESDGQVEAHTLTDRGVQLLKQTMSQFRDLIHVHKTYGNRTVAYHGYCDPRCPLTSIWLIQMFGGLQFADVTGPPVIATTLGVFTSLRASAEQVITPVIQMG